MMCLGWNNQETCKTRGQEVIDTRTETECPNILWFWVGLGLVALGVATKGNK